ncbi:kinase-like domain-containing protein [Colletotrichum navitas]|uniref:Kinase-like domain-containing protein n=1 Tax=Colletotrichum navitas TaxID=681940 RepID=A0AAD8PV88_9PEZI|nr:kinase-like domain-containing protein [Colletotrichum navitas]KAK1585334.1 kinase-like domain-containing protein [Colletotrichum navitas]
MSSSSPQLNGQPLRSAMKVDDDNDKPSSATAPGKVVQIAEPEADTAPLPPNPPSADHQAHHKRQYAANMAKRLTGRMGLTSSSRSSPVLEPSSQPPSSADDSSPAGGPAPAIAQQHHHHRHGQKHYYESQKLLAQLHDWLEHERKKKASRKTKTSSRRRSPHSKPKKELSPAPEPAAAAEAADPAMPRSRSDSIDSDSSDVSFDRLQKIIEDSMASMGINSVPQMAPKVGRRPSARLRKSQSRSLLQRTASSDTDYFGDDVVVPTCDAVLDNSKTLSYNGGGKSTDDLTLGHKADDKEKAWATFKNEIVRLTHTLKIKGWRRVPLDSGNSVIVQRLSGALTNAVYVTGKKPPPKLLLRIYGLEHLIDRENELTVLRRLARKKIGPRLLGCFTNGRFEEYFNSITLTPSDLREPETSKQIAKRMRELHVGIDVLDREKDEGPAVLKNWDTWLRNVEKKILALDESVRRGNSVFRGSGYVCGVEWQQFKELYDKYRELVINAYKGPQEIRERLVFAHNDTQYGNILRMRPDDEKSPLLQPANEHKQLVVIDFEYAAANVPGLEFANHFTEWAYDYHHETLPFRCNTVRYPTIQEQRRFLKAYVEHRPLFSHGGASTPRLAATDVPAGSTTPALLPTSSSSSIVEFMLDARVPPNHWKEEERRAEEATEAEVKELYEETRLWRGINSAQWVAWGIVQAKVPGFESPEEIEQQERQAQSEAAAAAGDAEAKAEVQAAADAKDEGDEYDYLSYAQDRAFFFLGDCVIMGLVRKEELPEDVQSRLKIVDF